MKTTTTMGVMLVTLLTATSCSETETDIDPEPGSGGQVSLGITPNLKVDAGSKASTKSVVNGDLITYTDYNAAPGLGVVVTNSDVTGWYTPDGTEYTGHHVWYMGDETGKNWISIKEKKDTYTVKNGDSLWGIARTELGDGGRFREIYTLNADTIEAEAKKRGRSSSSEGHWIYPGSVLRLPS